MGVGELLCRRAKKKKKDTRERGIDNPYGMQHLLHGLDTYGSHLVAEGGLIHTCSVSWEYLPGYSPYPGGKVVPNERRWPCMYASGTGLGEYNDQSQYLLVQRPGVDQEATLGTTCWVHDPWSLASQIFRRMPCPVMPVEHCWQHPRATPKSFCCLGLVVEWHD